MLTINNQHGMGWQPDLPDFRDFTVETETVSNRAQRLGQNVSIKGMLDQTGAGDPATVTLANSVDLRDWFSPIEDQGALGSCTAQAGVGLIEYFERRSFGTHINASRLFLYKATRNLIGWTGDTGAYLRTTMGAMALFGVPPEQYWPYHIPDFDKEPTAFCYAFAQNYQAIQYYRLDPPGTSNRALLQRIKANLAAGLPSMFGFTVYNSIVQAADSGKIPFPSPGDTVAGGHAVIAVGYDDKKRIMNALPGSRQTTGALLVRNSWGTGWGDDGYGWLPYEYVRAGLATDWWSLLKNEWVATGRFQV